VFNAFLSTVCLGHAYVDIDDVCRAYENFVKKILNGNVRKRDNSLTYISNAYHNTHVLLFTISW